MRALTEREDSKQSLGRGSLTCPGGLLGALGVEEGGTLWVRKFQRRLFCLCLKQFNVQKKKKRKDKKIRRQKAFELMGLIQAAVKKYTV